MQHVDKYLSKKLADLASDLGRDIRSVSRSQWIFSAILIANAFLMWLAIFLLFYEVTGELFAWISGIIFVLTLSVFVGLSFFLLYLPALAVSVFFVDASIAFLFFGWRGIEVVGIAVLFFSTCFGYFWIRRERKLLVKFLYSRLIRHGLPIFFTGLAFALSIFYNASPIGRDLAEPQLSEEFVSLLLWPVERVARLTTPEFSRNVPLANSTNSNEMFHEWVEKMPTAESKKTFVIFTKDLANRQISSALAPYKEYLHVMYFFGVFLIFRAVAMPIMWLAIGVGWLVIRVLLYKRVLKLKTIKSKKEILVM